MTYSRLFALVLLGALVLACAPAVAPATPTAPAAPTETTGPTAMPPVDQPTTPTELPSATDTPLPGAPTDSPATATPDPTTQPTIALPDDPWRAAELRDVRSGETLVINELTSAGLLVVIEPMAIWCSNCRVQQNEARTALASLGRDDIVYISLDVDPNETEPDLARYADEREYPWHFVVASRDVARSLAQTFGDQVLSPPSTPKIVVARDGSTEVSFGITRAPDLETKFIALLP